MSLHDDVAQFLGWIQTLDHEHLLNEDDVETKFVLPLFQHLGYEDNLRRGKYPVPMYELEKPGRKPEIDQIYFSTDEPQKQNADTSLLIVEVKEARKTSLEAACKQARFYGDRLQPPFLAVTNGVQLRVFKRHRFRGDEIVFDEPLAALREQASVERLYKLLHFECVKQTKEQLFDPHTHEQYVELMRAVENYPDLRAQLAKGEFSPSTTRSGSDLTVVRPKVAMVCKLPLPFGDEGHCRIEFSSLLLRGLTCHLTHQDILQNLLVGLGTDPDWQTRSFLRQTKHHTFEARLGQGVVILSEEEARDLCTCIDIAGKAYKDSIIEAEDLLKTWRFERVIQGDIRGFHILSVKPWLWKLMLAFTQEFDYDKGRAQGERSEWHIFEPRPSIIQICTNIVDDNILLWPIADNRLNLDEPGEYIDLLYYYWLDNGGPYSERYSSPWPLWREAIGPQGLWTAEYTKNWLTKRFIPTVLTYYNKPAQSEVFIFRRATDWLVEHLAPDAYFAYKERLRQIERERKEAYIDAWFETGTVPPLTNLEVGNAKQLAEYVVQVQSWLLRYKARRIDAALLRPYYKAFTELAKRADPKSLEARMDYLPGKLGAIGWAERSRETSEPEDEPLSTYADIIQSMERHMERIEHIQSEDHFDAELLSRVFYCIVDDGVINARQNQLNAAKEALLPLWKESRFERRYVFDNS